MTVRHFSNCCSSSIRGNSMVERIWVGWPNSLLLKPPQNRFRIWSYDFGSCTFSHSPSPSKNDSFVFTNLDYGSSVMSNYQLAFGPPGNNTGCRQELVGISYTLTPRLVNDDLFGACHRVVDPSPYYDNCVFDACGCDMGGDCMCYCEAIETYVRQCTTRGITINWRSKTSECREWELGFEATFDLSNQIALNNFVYISFPHV